MSSLHIVPDGLAGQLIGTRNSIKGDNNFCHMDGDKKYRYQTFKLKHSDLPDIIAALDGADTIIWRYDVPVEIYPDHETGEEKIRIRFAALKDGKQVLICENKEKEY